MGDTTGVQSENSLRRDSCEATGPATDDVAEAPVFPDEVERLRMGLKLDISISDTSSSSSSSGGFGNARSSRGDSEGVVPADARRRAGSVGGVFSAESRFGTAV